MKLGIFYHSKDILVDLQMIRQQRHSTDGKDVTVRCHIQICCHGHIAYKATGCSLWTRKKKRKTGLRNIWKREFAILLNFQSLTISGGERTNTALNVLVETTAYANIKEVEVGVRF